MANSTDLMIYRKSVTLFEHCYPIMIKFPQAEKFALSQELKLAFYHLMKSIVLANEIKHKRRLYQEEIEGQLGLLIVLLDLGKRRGYITKKSSLFIQEKLEEIGRMLGGWIKSTERMK